MNFDQNEVKELNKEFHKSSPEEIIRKSQNLFKDKIVYISSFGIESAIILHMISQIDKNFPIALLNTNFLFKQTLDYKNKLVKGFNLKNFVEIFPDNSNLQKDDPNNNLWKSDVEKCCELRKVKPLNKFLKKYNAWISGRKSYQGGERFDVQPFEFNNGKVVVNPLANFEKKLVLLYFNNNNLPKHPLVEEGYLSVGCTHCTFKPKNIEDPRSGRWINQTKTECGIHYKKD